MNFVGDAKEGSAFSYDTMVAPERRARLISRNLALIFQACVLSINYRLVYITARPCSRSCAVLNVHGQSYGTSGPLIKNTQATVSVQQYLTDVSDRCCATAVLKKYRVMSTLAMPRWCINIDHTVEINCFEIYKHRNTFEYFHYKYNRVRFLNGHKSI